MPTVTAPKPTSNLTGLRAFHGDRARQKKLIGRVRLHQEQDEIAQRMTGPKKGCTIWCSLDKYDCGLLADEMQIPMTLVYANENVFEGSTLAYAKKWPLRFVSAPKLGADLSLVPHRLCVWLMSDPESPYLELIKKPATLKLMKKGAELVQAYIDGETREPNQWKELSARARAAGWPATTGRARSAPRRRGARRERPAGGPRRRCGCAGGA